MPRHSITPEINIRCKNIDMPNSMSANYTKRMNIFPVNEAETEQLKPNKVNKRNCFSPQAFVNNRIKFDVNSNRLMTPHNIEENEVPIDIVLMGKGKHEIDSMNPFKSLNNETYDREESETTKKSLWKEFYNLFNGSVEFPEVSEYIKRESFK